MRVFELGLQELSAGDYVEMRGEVAADTHAIEALVHAWHLAITDQLYLRLVRDGLQVRVQDRSLFFAGLVVTVAVRLRLRVERLCLVSPVAVRLGGVRRTKVSSYCCFGVSLTPLKSKTPCLYSMWTISSVCSGVTLAGS